MLYHHFLCVTDLLTPSSRDKNRVYIYLPAFLRDKFDLQNGDKVEVDTDGTNIIQNQ
jgi:AbrB family looped-hinge helix DNA binding protein